MTRDEIVTGLKAGRTLFIDRRDAPALPIVQDLQAEGLATVEFEQLDEQSSRWRVRWAFARCGKHGIDRCADPLCVAKRAALNSEGVTRA